MVVANFQQVASPPDQIEAEAVAAFFYPEDRPLSGAAGLLDWRLNGQLTRLIQQGGTTGRVGEHLWIQADSKLRAPWVLLTGGGSRSRLAKAESFRQLVAGLLEVAQRSGVRRLVVGLDPDPRLGEQMQIQLVQEVWSQLGPDHPQCLVTVDQSWIKR